MNTLELKPGDKVGVLTYGFSHSVIIDVEFAEVKSISAKGYATLVSGVRYTPQGKEINARHYHTYICNLERAQEILISITAKKQQKEDARAAYLNSDMGLRDTACREAVKALIQVLNQHGWWSDEDGHMDVLESEIELRVERYLSEHDPI